MSFDFDQIQSLQKMLNESSNSQAPTHSSQSHSPNIPSTNKTIIKTRQDLMNPTSSSSLSTSNIITSITKQSKDPKEIWSDEEIPDETTLLANIHDTRPSPKYTYFFRNSLGTEEMFLGMNRQSSNSSIDASHLVIKVHFPGSTMKVRRLLYICVHMCKYTIYVYMLSVMH